MTFGGAVPPWNIIGALTQQDADALVRQALEAGAESEKILGTQ